MSVAGRQVITVNLLSCCRGRASDPSPLFDRLFRVLLGELLRYVTPRLGRAVSRARLCSVISWHTDPHSIAL
jgi:hypothetical protein